MYVSDLIGVSVFRSAARRFVPAAMIGLALVAESQALIVGNVPGVVPATNVNPATYAGWTQGDPGWDNVSLEGRNYVYLGDGWVLSARHKGYDPVGGVRLQTYLPDGMPGPIKNFYRIPSTYYFDYGYGSLSPDFRQYAVSNPATVQSEMNQTITLGGDGFTDLQLFRVSEDPGLPAVTLSTALMASDYTRVTAPEVVTVGLGFGRDVPETHWTVSGSSPNFVWTETAGAGNQQGYKRNNIADKRFGTNRLVDIRPSFNGDPSDSGAINYTQNPNKLFETSEVVSDATGVFQLTTGDGVTRDIISMVTAFDRQSGIGQTPLETQAISGNSGSGVFYKRGAEWELAGIVHAISTLEDQPIHTAVYGNTTIISDLWYYMQDYEDSIFDIMRDHADYSYPGDINLNGTVTGNGTGSTATDDISAFVAGWGYDNELGVGNVDSWKKGDLTKDGKTDVQDFLKLRRAFHGEIPLSVMTTLFGEGGGPGMPGGVPEPSAGALAALVAAALACRRWR